MKLLLYGFWEFTSQEEGHAISWHKKLVNHKTVTCQLSQLLVFIKRLCEEEGLVLLQVTFTWVDIGK